MERQKIIGREVVMQFGSQLFSDFNLQEEKRLEVYKQIYEQFTKNLTCDITGRKDQQGILLIGPKGVGKTICMKVFQKMLKDTERRFKWVSATLLKDLVADGVSLVEIKEQYGRGFHGDLYIDDLGFGAAEQNKFGNSVNIIAELIYERNELWLSERRLTHFSTNLATKSTETDLTIENFYGDRTYDRLKQMCKKIVWLGESLRS